MKKLDLMIFDLDGTLVSSGTDLANCINYTLNELKLEKRTESEIMGFVGDGISRTIQKALGTGNEKFLDEAKEIFSGYYACHLLDNTALYPNVRNVLENFKDKTKIVLTNKRYEFTMMIVRGLDMEKYFAEIVGIDSTPYIKPDPRIIEYLLDKYKADKEKTLITGDGINDIIVARNSGILSCALLNGLGNRGDLLNLKADYYCEDILEINSLFD
jgi:phosphoglycolate phosphatase